MTGYLGVSCWMLGLKLRVVAPSNVLGRLCRALQVEGLEFRF